MILDRTSLRESLVMILGLMPNSNDKSKIIKCGLGALLTKTGYACPVLAVTATPGGVRGTAVSGGRPAGVDRHDDFDFFAGRGQVKSFGNGVERAGSGHDLG